MKKNEEQNHKPNPGPPKPPKWVRKLQKLIHDCWQYHARCEHINMQVSKNESNGCWQINAAPVFQEVLGGEDDGKRVWAGFLFDVGQFSKANGVYVDSQALSSICSECSEYPKMMMYGRYFGRRFFLQLFQEPMNDTETVEVLDTLKQEVREKSTDEPSN